MNLKKRFFLLSAGITSIATPAWAEVMDKELSILGIWTWAFLGAILGWFAIRHRWWLAPFAITLPLLAMTVALSEWYDPHVGPAIAAEAGENYGLHAYAALAVIIVVTLSGLIFKGRPVKAEPKRNDS